MRPIHATDYVQNSIEELPGKFKAIALTGSGDLVDAVTGRKIRLLALWGHGTTSGTIKFQSGATTDLTGAAKVADGSALILPFNPMGWFETAVAEKLNAVLATMTAFNGAMLYVEV